MRFWFSIFFLIGLTTAVVVGCSANQSRQSRLDHTTQLLNQHRYLEAIQILEKALADDPSDLKTALMLAQSHMGNAGLEMFSFASDFLGQQDSVELDLVQVPQCSKSAISKMEGQDFGCLIYRAMKRAPQPEDPSLKRAKELFTTYYSPANAAPTEVNFMAAFVHLASAVSHLRALLDKNAYRDTQENIARNFFHHIKIFLSDLLEGFRRMRYSYAKISQYVVNLDGKPLIKVGSHTLVFSESLGVPSMLRFAAEVLADGQQGLNQNLDEVLSRGLNGHLGLGFVSVFRALDLAAFDGEGSGMLHISWEFEQVINQGLQAVANSSDQGRFDLIQNLWPNPPKIFASLSQAVEDTWEKETLIPLKEYYSRTASEWQELNRLATAWQSWLTDELEPRHREFLIRYLRDVHLRDPRLSGPPPYIRPDEIRSWQIGFTSSLTDSMYALLDGDVAAFPPLGPQAILDGLTLIFESNDWIGKNLWEKR